MAGAFRATEAELADAAGHRRLYGGGGGRDRLRRAGGGGRRQCRAGRRARCSWSRSRCRRRRPAIRSLTRGLVPADRPGDFAQALMDLGATICTPKRPACALCPWMAPCRARAEGLQESLSRRSSRRSRGSCAAAPPSWCCAPTTRCCCARARPRGCSAAWRSRRRAPGSPTTSPPAPCSTRRSRRAGSACPALVRHVFTHFPLELTVFLARVPKGTPAPRRHALDAPRGAARGGAARRDAQGAGARARRDAQGGAGETFADENVHGKCRCKPRDKVHRKSEGEARPAQGGIRRAHPWFQRGRARPSETACAQSRRPWSSPMSRVRWEPSRALRAVGSSRRRGAREARWRAVLAHRQRGS